MTLWRSASAALLLTITSACDPVRGPAVSDPPPPARDGGVDARPGDAASALCVQPDGSSGGGGTRGGNDVCNACSQAAPLPGQRCPAAACDCSTGCCCCR